MIFWQSNSRGGELESPVLSFLRPIEKEKMKDG
jgi:hypothetical protein